MKKSKKFGVVMWLICTITLCLCVFPINLIRRDTNVDPNLNGDYGKTQEGQSMMQSFQAQTSYLSEIAFDISFPKGKPEQGNLVFSLYREKDGKILVERSLALEDVDDNGFTYVSIDQWISRGDTMYIL